MAKTPEQRQRAAQFVRDRLLEQGRTVEWLAAIAALDRKTWVPFFDGDSWPRSGVRQRIEEALDLPPGSIDYVTMSDDIPEDIDPVDRAIDRSGLNQTNKLRLKLSYHEMLDQQTDTERRSG